MPNPPVGKWPEMAIYPLLCECERSVSIFAVTENGIYASVVFDNFIRHCSFPDRKHPKRLSGLLLELLGIHCSITPVDFCESLSNADTGKKSKIIRESVVQSHALHGERFRNTPKKSSSGQPLNVGIKIVRMETASWNTRWRKH